MFLASINLMLSHLPYMHVPDMPCSGQPHNMPESPCLGLLSSSCITHLPFGASVSQLINQIQTNQSRIYTPNYLLYQTLTLGPYTPALPTPGPGTRQQGTAPLPRSPQKLFKAASPKPACPAFLIPSHRNHNEVPLLSLTSQPTMVLLSVTPRGMMCILSQDLWVYNKPSFQWQLSSYLMVLLYLTLSIKTVSFKTPLFEKDNNILSWCHIHSGHHPVCPLSF